MTSNRLVDQLCGGLRISHGAANVSLAETHISWVIMAGERAYKLKKPIRNPFLDYSTLQLRRDACLKEVELNRRFAPELYLGVVAIFGASAEDSISAKGGAPPRIVEMQSSEEGTVVEFAVRMRRFPDDALLAHCIDQGRVTLACVELLARRVAEFHRDAAAVGKDDPWGSPEGIAQDQTENLEALENADLPAPVRQRLDAIHVWTTRQQQSLATIMKARKRDGYVRACHGDLHLENIIQWNGRLMPFDGIEFSERLRWIDTQSDTAFTSMDFVARGHSAMANRFTSAYLEATGDYGGLLVLRWYQVYRALVRAKVALLRVEQEAPRTDAATKQRHLVEHLIDVAHRFTQPSPARLVITHGVSGSGKTVGSQSRIDDHGMIRVRSDLERQRPAFPFTGSAADHSAVYSESAMEDTYQRMEQIARGGLLAGYGMIVDATFIRRDRRDRFRRLAEELGVPFQILTFSAPKDELIRRVRSRAAEGKDASDAGPEVLEVQLRTMEPLAADERRYVVFNDVQEQQG